ncbi:hypothetical protein EDEG_03648 [Edhazardia aedis USNM 41457]|uniref:KEN domain-containing protein n=1 Tax=Edhazardia aedis (strain USNM 41457) TaxID=1003232 RepID=J9D2R5_EDHAE|nr:hypothetical protein EDEG_03648 [Edhazardia aedis USNM 41457]|eukprot:EJW01874.1 hypothetical protein EDEG_03648 [Edhazardia aedis USNM 41457]
MKSVYNHPYFWNSAKIFNFYANLSDFIEAPGNASKRVHLRLERNKSKVFSHSWDIEISPMLVQNIEKYKEYRYKTIRGLLRVIRNKGRHFTELPNDVKCLFGTFPDGFISYFVCTFPCLLMVSHYSASCAASDVMFKEFYSADVI